MEAEWRKAEAASSALAVPKRRNQTTAEGTTFFPCNPQPQLCVGMQSVLAPEVGVGEHV